MGKELTPLAMTISGGTLEYNRAGRTATDDRKWTSLEIIS